MITLKKVVKAIIVLLAIIAQTIGLIMLTYSLFLYKGVETFYRIYIIIILIYFLLFIGYLLLRSIKKKKLKSFIIPFILSIIFIAGEFVAYYYLHNVYKAIESYSKNDNEYFSSLVTYNKNLTKDLKDKKIGIISDESDIEGNIIPLEIIDELKYKDNNKIIKYESTMELLHALKNKEIDAAFFSSNYVDMFYSLEGYENIKEETKVIYEKSKIIETKENEEKNNISSLTEPFTMLFIGVDSSKDGVTSGYNADVLILVTFNPKTLRATMTSVPRDTYIKTACSNGKYRRINTTTWGSSSDCAVKTIENMFDVKVDYYAKINFKGIVQLVDSLGGIDADINYSFCEQNSSRDWGKYTVYVEKGKQHLNGEQALALARNRHKPNDGSGAGKQMGNYCPQFNEGNRSDYTRGKNQMKVILGIVNAATKLKDPNQALDILEKISKNFQTNVKTNDVTSLYNLGKSIILTNTTNLINVQRTQVNGYTGDIYDVSSKSYPSVQIPYKGSIDDIKKEINMNLGKTKIEQIKKITFDLNKPFEDEVIGNKSYSQTKIATLADVSSYSVDKLKSYANTNNLKLKFIDIDTNQEITLTNYEEYKFHSQNEHIKTILDQISTLTIYVKKKTIIKQPEAPKEEEKPEENNNEQ